MSVLFIKNRLLLFVRNRLQSSQKTPFFKYSSVTQATMFVLLCFSFVMCLHVYNHNQIPYDILIHGDVISAVQITDIKENVSSCHRETGSEY
jgi:hypothetical protein